MNCVDLARAFLPLANAGLSPLLCETVLTGRQARRINAIMLKSGVYDPAGRFAFRVGLPAKSRVSGGIVAVVPRRRCIAVWSPGLDRASRYCGPGNLRTRHQDGHTLSSLLDPDVPIGSRGHVRARTHRHACRQAI